MFDKLDERQDHFVFSHCQSRTAVVGARRHGQTVHRDSDCKVTGWQAGGDPRRRYNNRLQQSSARVTYEECYVDIDTRIRTIVSARKHLTGIHRSVSFS